MGANGQLLLRLAAALNSGGDIRPEEFFAENFTLYDPSVPNWPRGLAGARQLVTAMQGNASLTALDIIEQGDKAVVRWSVARAGAAPHAAMIAIYRFENGLIVEDWGCSTANPWP